MVEGMETIVATVSGYHGSRRSKLIRLITAAGANYVGKMSKSTTHLICWQFEGEKYELAKKFGTIVVNHRWFEDCIKEGKRIPEHSYRKLSGQNAGFMMSDLSDLSLLMEQRRPVKECKELSNKRSMRETITDVIDLDSDEIENGDFDSGLMLDEDLFPKPGSITTERRRSKGKAVKVTSKRNWQAKEDNIKSHNEAYARTVDMLQSEDSDYLMKCLNKRRGNLDQSVRVDLAESSRRSRRLVKKNVGTGATNVATDDIEPQSRISLNNNDAPTTSNRSNYSNMRREEIEVSISSQHVTSSSNGGRSHEINHISDTGSLRDVQSDYLSDAGGRNMHEISSNHQNSEGRHENKDLPDHFARLQTSKELSCVICWTDFSSTRGVLPCGHRFCFSCIQNWADHMASNRKETTCPLCKTSFASITRVDGETSLDQKIYSQTVPCPESSQHIFLVPEVAPVRSDAQTRVPLVCCNCHSRDPVDLLIHCQICQTSCIHNYCLDPPLIPWTCSSCRDRRLFYQY